MRQLTLGPMRNFITLFGPAGPRGVAVVDPAWDAAAVVAALEADGRQLVAVFLTHHHMDHVNAVPELAARAGVPVYVQRAELEVAPQLAQLDGLRVVEPGARIDVDGLEVRCLHTPGHTPGSQCLVTDEAVFTGDTLFVGACGRCDLPGGSARELYRSLVERLGSLADETLVFPGHDYGDAPSSTLGRERRFNPYLRVGSEAEFLALRERPRR